MNYSKIDEHTFEEIIPQPPLAHVYDMDNLLEQKEFLQSELDLVNARIAKAKELGVKGRKK